MEIIERVFIHTANQRRYQFDNVEEGDLKALIKTIEHGEGFLMGHCSTREMNVALNATQVVSIEWEAKEEAE
ncbi:Uncharacterised protein [Streptococcus pneumoniae]|nr:Uncharacterised protein [Streptococcus pneumoniae]